MSADRTQPPGIDRTQPASVDRTQPPAPGPVRTFEFPAVTRSRLHNGVTLLHARHGDLPLVTLRAVLVDAGAAAEAAGEEGLAWLVAHALEGGTRRLNGAELAWELERLGAELETRPTWDALNVALTTRSDRLRAALDLLAEVVREPAFPEGEVERMRGEQLAEIMRRRTEPRGLADDAALSCIYAPDAPYARPLLGIADRIASFDSAAAAAFHRRRFTPGNSAIVIVGDVDADTARAEAERAFGSWTGDAEPAPLPATTPRTDRTTVYLVDRPSAAQSELRLGHVGVPRDHDDYYPLLVMNSIVAGAFTSRLNLCLREKHGFTYGVRSGFAFRRAAGPFIIQTAVASDVTARAISEALRELRGLIDEGVTDDEVRAARDYIAGTLPLSMQTTDDLAGRIAELHTFDLPSDHFDDFRARIGAVQRDDVVRVAREHLHLDRLAIVVVGSADNVRDELQALELGDIVHHEPGNGVPSTH
jgi:zinc protease